MVLVFKGNGGGNLYRCFEFYGVDICGFEVGNSVGFIGFQRVFCYDVSNVE